jgi:hypothetical protein
MLYNKALMVSEASAAVVTALSYPAPAIVLITAWSKKKKNKEL